MIESILIATDGSDAAHVAERWGVAFAARLRTRCYGITVVEERVTLGLRADSLGIPPGPLDAVENFLKVRADSACRRLADHSRQQGVECFPDVTHGHKLGTRGFGRARVCRFEVVVHVGRGQDNARESHLLGFTDAEVRLGNAPNLTA